MRTILDVLFVFIFLVISIPIHGIMWIISKFNKPWADLAQLRIVQWAFKVVYFIAGTKLEIIGEENVPKDEAVLYIGNHRSYFDIVLTYARCPRPTGYISKKGIKKVPSLSMWMKRLHCLFLDRDDMKQGLKIVLEAIDHVKNGISICVFPEGTRNRDLNDPTSLLPFKEGTFKIATKTKCKIIPMALTGTADILENNFPWIHKSKVTIEYGKPIDVTSLTKEEQKHLGSYCQNIIHEMLVNQQK